MFAIAALGLVIVAIKLALVIHDMAGTQKRIDSYSLVKDVPSFLVGEIIKLQDQRDTYVMILGVLAIIIIIALIVIARRSPKPSSEK